MCRQGRHNKEASAWYRKSVDKGQAEAQCHLGHMYDKGRGVPKSDKGASMWFRKAADQGHAKAQFNLGAIYDKAKAFPEAARKLRCGIASQPTKDMPRRSAAWARKTLAKGCPEATMKLLCGIARDIASQPTKGLPACSSIWTTCQVVLKSTANALLRYQKAAAEGN